MKDSDEKEGEGGRNFACGACGRTFGYKHVLQNHERTHTGEKPFECPECHKRFTRDHHLKTHLRLHTGERPYRCPHCERHFVQVANLRRHLRVHTGERPYACGACEARFSDSNQLRAHALIHRGEKPFACAACRGRFRRRHHLAHHRCPADAANAGRPRRGRRPGAYEPQAQEEKEVAEEVTEDLHHHNGASDDSGVAQEQSSPSSVHSADDNGDRLASDVAIEELSNGPVRRDLLVATKSPDGAVVNGNGLLVSNKALEVAPNLVNGNSRLVGSKTLEAVVVNGCSRLVTNKIVDATVVNGNNRLAADKTLVNGNSRLVADKTLEAGLVNGSSQLVSSKALDVVPNLVNGSGHLATNKIADRLRIPEVANGHHRRKPSRTVRILTPQQREMFLRDKVSMQTQAIDMSLAPSSPPPLTVIVPNNRFQGPVEGVLDLSSSRSDSDMEDCPIAHNPSLRHPRDVDRMPTNDCNSLLSSCNPKESPRISPTDYKPLSSSCRPRDSQRMSPNPLCRPRDIASKILEPLRSFGGVDSPWRHLSGSDDSNGSHANEEDLPLSVIRLTTKKVHVATA